MSRRKLDPSGPRNSATEIQIVWPRQISCSSSLVNPCADTPVLRDRDRRVDLVAEEQVRVPPLGPGQRCADELAEQRCRPVGPALELGVRLGTDPERMADQFDELDETAIGRRARAPQAVLLELG